jgi:hypothetical protein
MPATFGLYRIATSLGTGGTGDVYLGINTRLNRKGAIKRAAASRRFVLGGPEAL